MTARRRLAENDAFEIVGAVDVYRSDDATLATRRGERGFGVLRLRAYVHVRPRWIDVSGVLRMPGQVIDLSEVR